MANYVLSYRVPSDYVPGAETAAEWQAWFGAMGPGKQARKRRRGGA